MQDTVYDFRAFNLLLLRFTLLLTHSHRRCTLTGKTCTSVSVPMMHAGQLHCIRL
jgi:hypothetical protein